MFIHSCILRTMSSNSCKTANVNFGGINCSGLEFVNYSNSKLANFSKQSIKIFDELNLETITLSDFTSSYISNATYLNTLFDKTNAFMISTLDPAFLKTLQTYSPHNDGNDNNDSNDDNDSNDGNDDSNTNKPFNLRNITLGSFFVNILKKDKSISGFDQLFADRKCNLTNYISDFIINKYGQTKLDNQKYMKVFINYYINDYYTNCDILDNGKPYNDIFLKGRKEASDGVSTKNYFNGNINRGNLELDNQFYYMANFILMIHDSISYFIMNDFNTIPIELYTNLDIDVANTYKADAISQFFETQTLDILFVTESIPGIFNGRLTHDAIVVDGISDRGLCNTIIYRSGFITGEVVTDNYMFLPLSDSSECKEPPLILSCLDEHLTLMCFHASGKGITHNGDLSNSYFKQFVDACPNRVIIGCDLNIDYKKMKSNVDENLEIGTFVNKSFSCFKQRSPFQSQYNKAGVFDKKHSDFIVTRGFERAENQIIKFNSDGSIYRIDTNPDDHTFNKLIIPNSEYDFDHYTIMTEFYYDRNYQPVMNVEPDFISKILSATYNTLYASAMMFYYWINR